MICVANIATHRQTQQLTDEMVLKPSADDLPLVAQVLWTNEADDAVHEEGMEGSRHAVCSCFECQLVDPMMRLGGQGAALASLEVHHVIAGPRRITLAMMLKNAFAA